MYNKKYNLKRKKNMMSKFYVFINASSQHKISFFPCLADHDTTSMQRLIVSHYDDVILYDIL